MVRANAGAGLPLAAGSVHCVVTSPPYFGPRDYDCAPVVWVGDVDCIHEWTSQRHTPQPHGDDGRQSSGLEGGTNTQASTRFGSVRSAMCARCGAWYGQLGQEPTVELYVEHLVVVFREVWRVLRDDGVVFLNLGDSYAANRGRQVPDSIYKDVGNNRGAKVLPGYKPKDLMLIPYRVAIALQADGWWVRAIAPWVKRNAMPESVRDRPGVAHEDIFLLTKNARYFWDPDAVRIPQTGNAHVRGNGATPKGAQAGRGIDRGNNSFHAHTAGKVTLPDGRNRRTSDWYFESLDRMIEDARNRLHELCRLRDEGGVLADEAGLPLVFDIKTKGYKGAHFATFPVALVEPMIKAATSERGCCPDCGAPWVRIAKTKSSFPTASATRGFPGRYGDTGNGAKGLGMPSIKTASSTVGWRPTCDCYDDLYRRDFPRVRSARKRAQQDATGDWWRRVRRRPGPASWPVIPCLVLDPFGGTGTVGIAAAQLGRRAVIVDLSQTYLKQARERILDELFGVDEDDLEAGVAGVQLALWDLEPEGKEQ
jgi:DNA modification methylase